MTDSPISMYLRYTSWPIILALLGLIGFGVVAIGVAEQADGISGYSSRQLVFSLVGIAAFLACTIVPYQVFGRYAYLIYACTILVLVLVFFLPAVRGSHRWIDLAFFQVQPSELAKLTFIILLAWHLRYGDQYRYLLGLILPFFMTLVPMILILKEPDLGTSLLFLPTLYFMLFMAGAKIRHLLGIVLAGTILLFVPVTQTLKLSMSAEEIADRCRLAYTAYDNSGGLACGILMESRTRPAGLEAENIYQLRESAGGRIVAFVIPAGPGVEMEPFLKKNVSVFGSEIAVEPAAVRVIEADRFMIRPGKILTAAPLAIMEYHQIVRIVGWLNQDDPAIIRSKGYQLHQSKLVMGSGKLSGGDTDESGAYFRMLPDDHTDFIFSVIGGRWGFVGCLAVLLLYAVIFLFGLEIAVITYDPFGRLLAVGVLGLLLSQMLINI
ncbi:MAG: FtsW/RodA/SpoVE family cell cycle protein, partial [Planctomycetes bacterium]|nr:FtsW/RodA/SpoVE family cell cycle protein [Planctomycetota bacterium]